MLGYNWYDKEIRNTNPLKTFQLWLSYTLQNLRDILDLWPARHSLKPSEKHRFLNAAATSFAVETSFANFQWHSHQLHLGWVFETSSNAFLWVSKLVFKTLCKLELKCIQTYTFTLQTCPEIASWTWSPTPFFLQINFKTFPSLTSIFELNMHSSILKLNCGRVRKQKPFGGELQFRSPVAGLWCHYMSWCAVGYHKEPIKTCLDVNIFLLQAKLYI